MAHMNAPPPVHACTGRYLDCDLPPTFRRSFVWRNMIGKVTRPNSHSFRFSTIHGDQHRQLNSFTMEHPPVLLPYSSRLINKNYRNPRISPHPIAVGREQIVDGKLPGVGGWK
ncbi:hypothetical protein SUGI_1488240 [Cryptomeria japonica]|uniref:Uncharacterized protein n=1 Tax=Cryptomeria japonica TaxID=3369 RepID=A0AAD3NS33_CRYJA|nr:hypothetical protein SUGI_1373170 [Cryptomeria japonica]GLJ59006.1 hypothetical protein SUGI_1488240 [Cryptomeria japonica]